MANPILESKLNTSPHLNSNPLKNAILSLPKDPTVCILLCVLSFYTTGCGKYYSYKPEEVPGAIEQICLKENNLKVIARVKGKTVGAVFYTNNFLDDKGQILPTVHEDMGKVTQAVTRVALSTPTPFDFCTVRLRDRTSGNELVITRSLDDTKRSYVDMLGIQESLDRTIFGQSKYSVSDKSKNEENFDLEEITLESFLADQIAQRVRFKLFKGTEDVDPAKQSYILVEGSFKEAPTKNFVFSIIALKSNKTSNETLLEVLHQASIVLKGYSFEGYDEIRIHDYLNRQMLTVTKDVLKAYQNGKISDEQILKKYVQESQSIQEFFKVFGLNA